ncbi:BTAD domain-containing putative transcriptional regulator [Micromonospora sp. WMMD882]|uniref:AfsR/SARP family transcriptional regulator n=1 Tax=Micromonospora sp. WMMD882 TaxID=3015151 RepID=UPI00248CF375|nr:AfsR/SARP family transcriptional regulator [Micromonospora sp. WMMD882]WBB79882.1 BTAD domain-containing putative transcriptional regulator [Micromonospora sp. WMMD882]
MGLRLLGPVELINGDRPLKLSGTRQRIVLAVLGLNINRVVPVDQLIDAVWGADPPTTARGQIQICISGLRRLFEDAGRAQAISTRPPGYLLQLETAEVDSLHFAALVADARRQVDAGAKTEAVRSLRTALALWRGDPLSGVPSEQVQRAATVLAEQRLAALEARIQLDLELGAHQEAVSELQGLVGDHPLRERLHTFLMLALYRCGRQADALKAARQARTVFADELGLDPSEELQRLERAVLQRDPSLGTVDEQPPPSAPPATPKWTPPPPRSAPAVLPRQLPASIIDFVGRERQLDRIRQLLGRDPDGDQAGPGMPIVVVSGMAGVGKSSLAIRAAHELSDHYPDGQLYADLRSWDRQDHTAKLLARFLRALGVNGSAIPDGVEERGELYRSMLSGKRLLLVLDDVPPDIPILPLLPGSSSCAVVVTSRVRLTGLPSARLVDLGVFDLAQSLEMLTAMVGPERVEAGHDDAAELANLCGGLPLALRITGARLASRPHWRLSGLVHRLRDEAKRLDEFTHHGLELRSNMELAYRALDDAAQRLLRLCSVMRAPDFPSWTAAALLDSSSAIEAEDILESLVDAQFVDIVQFPDAAPRYRLHDLVRVYAAEKLAEVETDEERTAALARVLSGWLALAEEAHRSTYGGSYTTLHGTAPRWRMDRADAAAHVGDPADWWEAERRALIVAVRQSADAGLAELCWDLALTSVSLFEAKGYFDDWRECGTTAYAAAERAGNRTGMAAMRYSLGTLHMFQGRLAEADACFTTALEIFTAEGVEYGGALVLRNAAHIDRLRGDTTSMLTRYEQSLEIMRRVGDRIGEAHIMRSLAQHRMDGGDHRGALELLDRALTICQETGCLRVEAQVTHRFAEVYLATDQIELARQALHRVLRIVRDTGDRIGEMHALYGLGLLRHREGRPDNAAMILTHTLERSRRLGERLIEARARYSLGEIALGTGRVSVGVAHLRAARDLFQQLGSTLWYERACSLLAEADLLPEEPPSSDGAAGLARQVPLPA